MSEVPQKSYEETVLEQASAAIEQLNAVADGLLPLMMNTSHLDEQTSMRLQSAAENIGRIANSAHKTIRNEYGSD